MTSNQSINPEDYIIQSNDIRDKLGKIINKQFCTIDEFKDVFLMIELDDIYFIGK